MNYRTALVLVVLFIAGLVALLVGGAPLLTGSFVAEGGLALLVLGLFTVIYREAWLAAPEAA